MGAIEGNKLGDYTSDRRFGSAGYVADGGAARDAIR
jgi:hypothetical protein